MKAIYPITQLLEKYIPNIRIYQQFNDRIVYILPSDKKSLYQRVLIELEKEYLTFGISSVYVAGSHLNDVYMELTKEPELTNNNNNNNTLPDLKTTLKFLQEKNPKLQKCPECVILHKKLYSQAKNSLPIWAIFISWFLIYTLAQLSLDNMNDNVIVFGTTIESISRNKSMAEIRKVRDLKGGLFIYDNLEYNNNSSLQNKMAAYQIHTSTIYFHLNEKMFHTAMLSFHLAYKYNG